MRARYRLPWACALTLIPALLGAQPGGGARSVKAIVGANVVNVETGASIINAVVVIDGDRIGTVGPAGSTKVPEGAEVIKASGRWLVPGMMNMHTHLGVIFPGRIHSELVNETEAALGARMAANARAALLSGVTTIRLTGERGHADLSLRRAIERGDVAGPRIITAGRAIIPTGGHGAGSSDRSVEADGPAEFRRAVRSEIFAGVEWIKIAISGGINDTHGAIAASHMTKDELEAVIDTAHRHGVRVTAHSGSPVATSEAVEAGIDCIEHGYFLTEEVLRRMAEKGTWLVPTILVSRPNVKEFAERNGLPEWYVGRAGAAAKPHLASLQSAIKSGVKIALGTDYLPSEIFEGTTATIREAEEYVEAGMTPIQALRAATLEPAHLLGISERVGTIDSGKYADLLLLDRDPTRDIAALRTIRFVMKGGAVYRNELTRGAGTSSRDAR